MGGGICGSISQLFGVTPTLFKLDDIFNCHNLQLFGVKKLFEWAWPNIHRMFSHERVQCGVSHAPHYTKFLFKYVNSSSLPWCKNYIVHIMMHEKLLHHDTVNPQKVWKHSRKKRKIGGWGRGICTLWTNYIDIG